MQIPKHTLTLLLLCLGYFIDFYDLTLMSVSYPELISEKFHLSNTVDIQQTYLLISNYQTLGILIGALLFGVLGDKLGRARAIQYSILLYSITTLLAVYTESLPLFIACRLLAYIGLATEFSTSTVLIYELFAFRSAAWGTAILYTFGVLGGIAATSMGFISWQATFLLGGGSGCCVYLARRFMNESESYQQNTSKQRGSFSLLLGTPEYLRKLLRYFAMITPYQALITMMFIFPNYIIEKQNLGDATRLLLLGFFIGNIISSLISPLFIQLRKQFMFVSLLLFGVLMLGYRYVPESWLFIYSLGLGFVGGGYPIIWAQQVASEFPATIRSLASNTLFAMGRSSGIFFNLLISAWLVVPERFILNAAILTVAVFMIAFMSVYWTRFRELS